MFRGVFALLFLFALPRGQALAAGEGACFDFSKPVREALRDPSALPLGPDGKDAGASGKIASGGAWAALRGRVDAPLSRLAELLRDPVLIKDPKRVNITKKEEPREGFDAYYTLDLWFRPLFFVTVEWREQWGHVKLEPAPKKKLPRLLVSYQKSEGTSHIRRLCGSVLLEAVSPSATEVYLVEELDSSHQEAQDILKGHEGTLRSLREKAKK